MVGGQSRIPVPERHDTDGVYLSESFTKSVIRGIQGHRKGLAIQSAARMAAMMESFSEGKRVLLLPGRTAGKHRI